MKVIKPAEIIEEISNLKTGEKYKNDEEWKTKGIPAVSYTHLPLPTTPYV